MPTIRVDIDNADLTVTRPVAQRIAYDLISALGLPNATRVIMPGSSDPEDLPITILDRGTNPVYGQELKVILEMEETFVDNRIYTDSLYQNENKPLFSDPNHGILVSPIYAHSEINIGLKFRFPSKQAAEKQLADMKRNIRMFTTGVMHEVEYTYFFPKVNLVILTELYRVKELKVQSGMTLDEWLRSSLHVDMTTAFNRSGSETELVKKELQSRIHGEFDFDILPEKAEKDENQRVHVLTFNYKITYDKILSTVMTYPHILNNSHIGDDFFDKTIPYELGYRLTAPPRMVDNLDHFTQNKEVTGFIDGVPIPHYHDWYPKYQLTGLAGVLRVLLEVDEGTPREVFNLQALGLFEFKEELINYAKLNYENLGNYKESILHIVLYEDGKIKDGNNIIVDSDLNIETTFDMDMTKTYSVWVAVLGDFNKLSNKAFEQIRRNASFCLFILKAIDPTLEIRGLLPSLLSNGTIDKRELMKSIQYLSKKRNPNTGSSTYNNYRVGSFVISVND